MQPPSRTGGKEATCMKVQEIVAQVHCCQQLGKGEKKKRKKNSHNRNEIEMVNTLTEKKCISF